MGFVACYVCRVVHGIDPWASWEQVLLVEGSVQGFRGVGFKFKGSRFRGLGV